MSEYEIIGKCIPTLSGFTRTQGVNLCFGGDPDLVAAIFQATITLKLFAGARRPSLVILGGHCIAFFIMWAVDSPCEFVCQVQLGVWFWDVKCLIGKVSCVVVFSRNSQYRGNCVIYLYNTCSAIDMQKQTLAFYCCFLGIFISYLTCGIMFYSRIEISVKVGISFSQSYAKNSFVLISHILGSIL